MMKLEGKNYYVLVDGYVFGKILGDGVDLSRSMSKVLVTFLSKLPVLRFMVLHCPATVILIQTLSLHKRLGQK